MPASLPQIKPQSPSPAIPPQFKEPPKAFNAKPLPKGTKPGQVTSPYRINRLGPPLQPPPAVTATAGAAAGGLSAGAVAAAVVGAIAFVLFFDEPLSKDQANVKMQPPEPPKEVELAQYEFRGGQSPVQYKVDFYISYGNGTVSPLTYVIVWGAISGLVYIKSGPGAGNSYSNQIFLRARNQTGQLLDYDLISSSGGNPNILNNRAVIVNIARTDGRPDTGGDPPPLNNPTSSAPGNSLGAPSAAPPSAAPAPSPKAPGLSSSLSSSPGSSPSPAPTPNPGPTPQPQKQPTPQPEPNPYPFADPSPRPGLNLGAPPGASPSPNPSPAPSGQSNRSPSPAPAPAILIQPGGNPGPLTFGNNPTTGNPEPKAPPLTSPNKSPDPEKTTEENIGDQIKKLIGPLAIAIAAIDALVQPAKIRAAAESATCDAFAPGGCNAPIANNAAAAATNSANNGAALAGINALLNTLQTLFLQPILTAVNLINTKLGPLMSGANGISGFLGRLSSSLGIDRALNLIAIAANLHNAMMLSANLKITLLEVLSSVGNATGVLETSEGENVDLNQVFNQGIETFITTLIGVDNYAGLKVGLRKYSAIYRSATNVISNVGNMFSSIGNGIEVIGERTGKIGNAIRAAGMVRENAYQWMSERMTVHTNKFMTFQTKVGDVTEVLEAINEIAESTIEGQQSYTEAVKATTEFKKVLEEGTKEGAKDAENKAIAEEAAKIKTNLSKDPTGEKDTGYLSFLTD